MGLSARARTVGGEAKMSVRMLLLTVVTLVWTAGSSAYADCQTTVFDRSGAWRAFGGSHAAAQNRDAASAEGLFRSGFQFPVLQRIREGERLLRSGMGVHALHDARRLCSAIQKVHRRSDQR